MIGGETTSSAQVGWQANAPFHLLSLKRGSRHLLTYRLLGGDVFFFDQKSRGQVCGVVTLPDRTLFKSLFNVGCKEPFLRAIH